jgi:DNA polymerase V
MNTPSSPVIVYAGFPSPGEEYREHPLDLHRLLGLAAEGSFCHLMRSSELSAAGISWHDLLIVSPTIDAAHQDIVVTQVNHTVWTRRLIRSAEVMFLVPEDPASPNANRLTILPTDHFRMLGVVLCSIHPVNEIARTQLRHWQEQDVNTLLRLDQPEVFCVRVRGTSMQAAGIHYADVLVVDRAREAKENDIIIASLDGSFFVKRFIKSLGAIFLLSDNPLSPPIPISSQRFQIWGVVLYCVHVVHEVLRHRLDHWGSPR